MIEQAEGSNSCCCCYCYYWSNEKLSKKIQLDSLEIMKKPTKKENFVIQARKFS